VERIPRQSQGGLMIINQNLSAMFAHRQLGINEAQLAKQYQKLSSGLRINRAGDDASGLAVSEKLRAQIRGLSQASRNTASGINFIQTTEGYLDETTSILQRLRELAVQSANGIYSDQDRMLIQVEVSQLVSEIDRIASHAQFNGMNLLTGRFGKDGTQVMRFQVGANMDQNISVFIGDMSTKGLQINCEQDRLNMTDIEDANRALATIDRALQIVTAQRANLGAVQNRLEHTQKGIDVARENMQASESVIRDSDMALEMTKYVKDQILMQAAGAMLGQANINSQNLMRLLGM